MCLLILKTAVKPADRGLFLHQSLMWRSLEIKSRIFLACHLITSGNTTHMRTHKDAQRERQTHVQEHVAIFPAISLKSREQLGMPSFPQGGDLRTQMHITI